MSYNVDYLINKLPRDSVQRVGRRGLRCAIIFIGAEFSVWIRI